MSSSSTTETVERVCVNLRVSKSVKRAYESAITEKYGRKRPYTGTELEREFRLALDIGTVTELYDSMHDLADAFGKAPSEKKILSSGSRDATEVVGYRVAKPVRNGIMALASNNSCSSPGMFVERIMHSYAVGESADERLIDLADRIKQASGHKFNAELSAKERRTKAIAAELEDWDQFTTHDFNEAVEAVPKISPSDHIREEYMDRVLDELDATWWSVSSSGVGVYTAADDVPPEAERDTRYKPYLLMDDDDKRLAIKTGFYTSNKRTYTVADALEALQNKPQHKTVRSLMRDIGSKDGFKFVSGSERRGSGKEDILTINRKVAIDKHRDLARVVEAQQDDEADSINAADKMDTDGTQWVQKVAESLPEGIVSSTNADAVIKNKIVQATTTDEDIIDESGGVRDEFLDAVTDDQVAQVKQHLKNGTEEPVSEPSKGGVSAGETTIQQSNSAQKVRTDGGK